ncbi:NERD domain-containing protein [Actinomadura sp. 9N407]|uniref:NERD domain-containing protein n=1 Tax=Actinomadura sp. 9N407 TaxID=3375154 RepID=UPI0037B1C844
MPASGEPLIEPPSLSSPCWFQERRSKYPWERDGLDHTKKRLPAVKPYRAWSFSRPSHRRGVRECDLLATTPGGIYLLELKGHSGRVVNRKWTWRFHGSDRVRGLKSPLPLLDWKPKELRQRLLWADQKIGKPGVRTPRIEPAILLTDPGLVSELGEVQRTRVFGRDGVDSGLPWIWRDLLERSPESEPQRTSCHRDSRRSPGRLRRRTGGAGGAHSVHEVLNDSS